MTMTSRSDSVTLTLPQERFAFPRTAARSTEPEVFTFERIPAQATAVRSYVPIRPKKRCTRVMYPAKVRMHLPPPERSQAKRWLLVLSLVVLWQIYTEEPCADAPLGSVEAPASEYQGFSFQSPEELAHIRSSSEPLSGPQTTCRAPSPQTIVPENSCPKPAQDPESSRPLEQRSAGAEPSSAGKNYLVALLVYHRLGSES